MAQLVNSTSNIWAESIEILTEKEWFSMNNLGRLEPFSSHYFCGIFVHLLTKNFQFSKEFIDFANANNQTIVRGKWASCEDLCKFTTKCHSVYGVGFYGYDTGDTTVEWNGLRRCELVN
jgi:hypothetical protein